LIGFTGAPTSVMLRAWALQIVEGPR